MEIDASKRKQPEEPEDEQPQQGAAEGPGGAAEERPEPTTLVDSDASDELMTSEEMMKKLIGNLRAYMIANQKEANEHMETTFNNYIKHIFNYIDAGQKNQDNHNKRRTSS